MDDKKRYMGCVELVSDDKILGWAIDTQNDAIVEISILADGVAFTKVKADLKRPDVERKYGRKFAGFSFRVSESLKAALAPRARISVLLPDESKSNFLGTVTPFVQGTRNGKDPGLAALLKSGKIVSPKSGQVIMPLRNRKGWGEKALSGYDQGREIFKAVGGVDLVIMYGTLLGCIREHDFLGNDDDFDAAFFSDATCAEDAAADLVNLAEKLKQAGYKVNTYTEGNFHFFVTPNLILDVFVFWIEDEKLRGYNFNCPMVKADFFPLTPKAFKGHTVLVPRKPDMVLRGIYGPGWKTPDPLFQWRVGDDVPQQMERFRQGAKTRLTKLNKNKPKIDKPVIYDQGYWDKFYDRTIKSSPSQFAALISTELDGPSNIIDIGCGNGRDSDFFHSLGHNVLGLDGSHVAIEENQTRVKESGHGDIQYRTCRIGNDGLVDALAAKEGGVLDEGKIVVYSRFFLHAIPEEVEKKLIEELSSLGLIKRVYFEYRCGNDSEIPKYFGEHYRRFIRPEDVSKLMKTMGGFEKTYEYVGFGVAKYRSEDAFVCRQFFHR